MYCLFCNIYFEFLCRFNLILRSVSFFSFSILYGKFFITFKTVDISMWIIMTPVLPSMNSQNYAKILLHCALHWVGDRHQSCMQFLLYATRSFCTYMSLKLYFTCSRRKAYFPTVQYIFQYLSFILLRLIINRF